MRRNQAFHEGGIIEDYGDRVKRSEAFDFKAVLGRNRFSNAYFGINTRVAALRKPRAG